METILRNKAAIYIRVSTQFQIDKDSLQVQRRELAAYSELVLGIKDYDVFEDPGYSGKDTSRPAYQRMMARLRTGEYSHLLVWKIDRISRNLLDFATMYSELKRIGVTFVSKNEQFDTSTAIGEAMLKIILVFAELERQMTAERVTAVMLSRANNGQWNGGRVPYGYDWDTEAKTFSVNEKEAEVYRYICNLYEEKQSLLKVCQELNGKGLHTRSGRPWNPVGVHKLLTNVFYKGVYRYNVHSDGKGNAKRDSTEWIDVEDHHPAIIDDVRFDRLNFMLKRNVRKGPKKGDTYTGKAVHIFAGLLQCGNCGANMTATQDRRRADGHRPSMYGCAAKRRKTSQCDSKYVNDLSIAPLVFSTISGVMTSVGRTGRNTTADDIEQAILSGNGTSGILRIEGLDAFVEAIQSGTTGFEYSPPSSNRAQSDDIQMLKDRKRKLESSLGRLQSLFLYGDDGIAEKDYRIERKRILDELTEIDSMLEKSVPEVENFSDKDFASKASYLLMVDKLLSGSAKDPVTILKALEPSVPKDFMNRVIDRITITSGKVTVIRFKNGITVRFFYE